VEQKVSDLFVGGGPFLQSFAMAISDLKVLLEKLFFWGAAPDGKKVDDLDEKAGASLTGAPHRLDQPGQSGKETIVTDAKKGPTGDVPDSGGFHDQSSRLTPGELYVPIEDILGDKAFFRGPPRDHGRHPRPFLKLDRAHLDGLEPS